MQDAWLDVRPGSGCRCPECFRLAEYVLALTGNDHGLPRAPGHLPLPVREPEAASPPVKREAAPQPWIPRPARKRAA